MPFLPAFATDSDLQAIEPDILNHGILSWSTQLQDATDTLIQKLKSEWWVDASKAYANENIDMASGVFLDPVKLDALKFKRVTCLYALKQYIYNTLSTAEYDDDPFTRKKARYEAVFADEWALLLSDSVYDFTGDSQFSDLDSRRGTLRSVRV